MNIYFLILLNIFSLIYIIVILKYEKLRTFSSILVYSIIISLFIICRDFNYGDTISYTNYYISDYVYLDFEPFFSFLSSVFRYFCPDNPIYFLFFISFLTIIFMNYSLYKLLSFPKALICIWAFNSSYTFFYFTFETIRDGLAYSIVFYAFTFLIKERNIKKYLFFIFIASMFHYSYMLFIFLPLILKLNNRIVIISLMILVYFFTSVMLNVIANLDPDVFGILVRKIAVYREMNSESKTILIRNIIFIFMLPFVFKYKINNIYFKIYLFFIFILIATLPFDEINRRFLFKGTLLLLIPIVIFVFKHKLLLPFVFLVLFYFNVFLINYNAMYGLLNYKPFIEFKL